MSIDNSFQLSQLHWNLLTECVVVVTFAANRKSKMNSHKFNETTCQDNWVVEIIIWSSTASKTTKSIEFTLRVLKFDLFYFEYCLLLVFAWLVQLSISKRLHDLHLILRFLFVVVQTQTKIKLHRMYLWNIFAPIKTKSIDSRMKFKTEYNENNFRFYFLSSANIIEMSQT